MKNKWFLLLLLTLPVIKATGQKSWPAGASIIRIDTINIQKNWRTKDRIILKELGIQPGTDIDRHAIETGITRIWNIGNFSDVRYVIDTLHDGRTLLNITAKDAFTIVPILSFSGNKDDFKLTAGVSDNNFLGKNLHVGIMGSYGSNVTDFSIKFTIPRQLLYKNMAIHTSVTYGHQEQYRFDQGEKVSGVGYEKKEVVLGISNPWNRDFQYTFSPDFGLTFFQHTTDSALIPSEIPHAGAYKINYLQAGVSESIGYIKRMRHQRDGYLVAGSVRWGIGLDPNSPQYLTVGLSASYYKLFNPVIQLSVKFSTAYTTSDVPSLLFYRGNRDVKGTIYGEISGKAYYTAYTGAHFTYFNRNWFALEQSFFINWGNGADRYGDIYTSAPIATIGTGVSFMVPMIPWLYLRLYLTWPARHGNWFAVDF
jgi:outer membrane protein assembly factor BamA